MGEHRYNIQYVCDHTGISRSTVSTLYHDRVKRIDYETLERLCELFDCSPCDILIRKKEEK
jgi:putative transcriptional regulator